MWQRIDDSIFDHQKFGIQRISSTLEYYTSIGPFTVARMLLVVGISPVIVWHLRLFSVEQRPMSLFMAGMWGVITLVQLFMMQRFELVTQSKGRNPLRVLQRHVRMIEGVGMTVILPHHISTGEYVYCGVWCSVVLFRYFSACDMLPPHVRYQWRRSTAQSTA